MILSARHDFRVAVDGEFYDTSTLIRPAIVMQDQEVRFEYSFVPEIQLDHAGVGGPTQRVFYQALEVGGLALVSEMRRRDLSPSHLQLNHFKILND